MVALRDAQVIYVDISEAIGKMKAVNPTGEMVRAAKAIGIHFGDE
jgi:ATP-dependent phosphofructokinase / diphosphate-dependent phosphofructokinase